MFSQVQYTKYYPWKISEFDHHYRKEDNPKIDIALIQRAETHTETNQYASGYGTTINRIRATTCGDGICGYSIHTITIPEGYTDGIIHHSVNNGYDHVFYIEPITDENEVILALEKFIVNIPDYWIVNEYNENKEEFEKMLDKISPVIKVKVIRRIIEYDPRK